MKLKQLDKLIQEEADTIVHMRTAPVVSSVQKKYYDKRVEYHKGRKDAYEHIRRLLV